MRWTCIEVVKKLNSTGNKAQKGQLQLQLALVLSVLELFAYDNGKIRIIKEKNMDQQIGPMNLLHILNRLRIPHSHTTVSVSFMYM
ncbi:hypothetical protein PMSD_01590 [Paenibacillus macquariensis subsp. defensor]|nr:hypothetical protein PMSD_01590 [Paenibacillus macquariensis subsp. defensor]